GSKRRSRSTSPTGSVSTSRVVMPHESGGASASYRSGGVARRLVDRQADDQPDRAGRTGGGIAPVIGVRAADVECAPDVLLDRRVPAQLDVVVRVVGVEDRHARPRV